MAAHTRSPGGWWLPLLGVLLSFAILAPRPAAAQSQEPLRLTVLNVSERGGGAATRSLTKVLESNENVDFYDTSDVITGLQDANLTVRSLRKSSLRRKYRARIKKAMRRLQLEGLMLVDVYSRGKKIQVVVIGPEGIVLADLKRSIRRGKLPRGKAIDLLKSAFEALGPEVLAFREQVASEGPPEDPDPEDPPDPKGNGDAQKRVVQPPKPEEPGLKREIEVGVGMFVGRRDLAISAERATDYSLTHGTPFLGLGGRLNAVIAALTPRSAVTVTAFGSYAPFVTQFRNSDTGEIEDFDSTFFRGGGELGYLQGLTSFLFLDVFAGAEITRLTIEPNRLYTGTNYLLGRAGLGLGFRFGEGARLRLHGGVAPVFTASNSAGAFGESPVSVGFEGGARLAFTLFEGTFLELNYTFQRVAPEFPDPVPDLGGPRVSTASQDMMHTGNALLGLRF